jgi:hypothetical protein
MIVGCRIHSVLTGKNAKTCQLGARRNLRCDFAAQETATVCIASLAAHA